MNKRSVLFVLMLAFILACCSPAAAPGSWSEQDTGTGDAFFSVNFVNESVGWVNGQTDRGFESADENENANKPKKPAPPGKKPEDPLKANQGFEVLKTTDGGQTWKQIKDQFKYKIRSVRFVDPMNGWSLTIDRDILHTTDGGESWTLQRKAGTVKMKLIGNRRDPFVDSPEQIENIFFVDSTHGWAWGGGRKDEYTEQPGAFLSTVDAGAHWNEIAFPFDQAAGKIFFLDRQYGWAGTINEGAFYSTTDGGLNWTSIKTKRPELVFDSIFFTDKDSGWVVGHSGRMAKTTDGGRTWRKMYEIKDEFIMRDIFFSDRNHGWAVGDNGAILYTSDAGVTWISVASPIQSRLLTMSWISPRLGWAVGLKGSVIRFDGH
ncbi:MAG: hypothetical protein DMF61_21955 [Blastocatellia bacterium AA13]|nr:MAG: hypothetical protein DMF61_21955 [Blastocatellia bacterium AA13]